MKIDSENYLDTLQIQSILQSQMAIENIQKNDDTDVSDSGDSDKFVTTAVNSAEPIPSENYNNIKELIQTNQQNSKEEQDTSAKDAFAQILEDLNVSDSKKSAGANDEKAAEEEETVTTETVVMPDGSIFLKTTVTAEDGTQNITMSKIADGRPMSGNDSMQEMNQDEAVDFMAAEFLKLQEPGNSAREIPAYNEELSEEFQVN